MKKSKFKSSEELHKKGYRYGSIEIKLSKEKSLNMVLYQVDYYGKNIIIYIVIISIGQAKTR